MFYAHLNKMNTLKSWLCKKYLKQVIMRYLYSSKAHFAKSVFPYCFIGWLIINQALYPSVVTVKWIKWILSTVEPSVSSSCFAIFLFIFWNSSRDIRSGGRRDNHWIQQQKMLYALIIFSAHATWGINAIVDIHSIVSYEYYWTIRYSQNISIQ